MRYKRIELSTKDIKIPEKPKMNFEIEPFSKYCLINGIDQLDFLTQNLTKIEKYEQAVQKY